jgi:hypothetical protein
MQTAAVVLLLLSGLIVENLWVSAAGIIAHICGAGIAGWDEDEDLRRRFGERWIEYRRAVRGWVPRFRPWFPRDRSPARLYVSESCGMCSEVGLWFARRGALHLDIVAAEHHPSRSLTRITYDPNDGTEEVSGICAISRALDHIHLGWAMLGWLVRLPGLARSSNSSWTRPGRPSRGDKQSNSLSRWSGTVAAPRIEPKSNNESRTHSRRENSSKLKFGGSVEPTIGAGRCRMERTALLSPKGSVIALQAL